VIKEVLKDSPEMGIVRLIFELQLSAVVHIGHEFLGNVVFYLSWNDYSH